MKKLIAILFLGLLCLQQTACVAEKMQDREIDPAQEPSLRILFLGNSHTAFHNVPDLVKSLIDSSGNYDQVFVDSVTGGFLKDFSGNASFENKLRTGKWNFVVMHGQEISMSGRFLYSTSEAESLSQLANESGAKVIWFAEWGRRGVEGETKRTEDIYQAISSVNRDVVSPVGRVWVNVLAKRDDLVLHSADGNHATGLGASLAALTLYSSITKADCRQLPTIESKEYDEELQSFLKSAVWQTLEDDSTTSTKSENMRFAIRRVLDLDMKLGADRDIYCQQHSLAEAVKKYVLEIRAVDFSGCSDEFSAAFIRHTAAWENSIPFFERFPDLRGEMHELF